MNYITMVNRTGENLNLLDPSSTFIDGRVTQTGVKNRINQVYLEELFPLISNKNPQDFEQETYPINTYTATGTVDAATTSTNLKSTTAIFNNSMEGFKISNPTTGDTAKITTYVSTTEVVVDADCTSWVGNTIYVLGNEFTLGGDISDSKEIVSVQLKYSPTDALWYTATRINKRNAIMFDEFTYSPTKPAFYLSSISVGGVPTRLVGVMPYPTGYDGIMRVVYVNTPPALVNDTDKPILENIGISEVIVNAVTAWGFKLMQLYKDSDYYFAEYKQGCNDLLANYKPKFRSGAKRMNMSPYRRMLLNREI